MTKSQRERGRGAHPVFGDAGSRSAGKQNTTGGGERSRKKAPGWRGRAARRLSPARGDSHSPSLENRRKRVNKPISKTVRKAREYRVHCCRSVPLWSVAVRPCAEGICVHVHVCLGEQPESNCRGQAAYMRRCARRSFLLGMLSCCYMLYVACSRTRPLRGVGVR